MKEALNKLKKIHFNSAILWCIGFIGFGAYMLFLSAKDKTSLNKITGHIEQIEMSHPLAKANRNEGKHRFISIENAPFVFVIYVGDSLSENKPLINRIDQVDLNKEVTIYFADKLLFQTGAIEQLNTRTLYIDQGNTSIYETKNYDHYLGYFLLIGALVVFILILKRDKII